ncbi:hypothetical protein A3D77_04865 [Candidatus Gottesmanbacteria bacterium RIFCSPHIGHO2_02_FULL_39_11]|uniref:Uncharacterized protein n=1 Tax=Candidatus Gottesmanbacteria bacterium RIFCSPHIGHO2_02_FULL_39_11 TaxID=1798382 RepID=A0A1F5ZLU6_9BACT|nr:MAG: hypothetical protein A3D77_04865 [Candidatus Gottesmanbacteria bacterium RIFCSPHIGHO2_02_FULL_39_11]
MRLKKLIIIFFLLPFFLLFPARADAIGDLNLSCGFSMIVDPPEKLSGNNTINGVVESIKFIFDFSKISQSEWDNIPDDTSEKPEIFKNKFQIKIANIGGAQNFNVPVDTTLNKNSKFEYTITNNFISEVNNPFWPRTYEINLNYFVGPFLEQYHLCQPKAYTIVNKLGADISVSPVTQDGTTSAPNGGDIDAYWKVTIQNVDIDVQYLKENDKRFVVSLNDSGHSSQLNFDGRDLLSDGGNLGVGIPPFGNNHYTDTTNGKSVSFVLKPLYAGNTGSKSIDIYIYGTSPSLIKSLPFTVYPKGQAPSPTPTPGICPFARCSPPNCSGECSYCPWSCPNYATPAPSRPPAADVTTLCKTANTGTPELLGKCLTCADNGGIWSAIGCLPTDLGEFINKYLFVTGIGIIGGVAFLYLLYGSFLIMTSAGNPEQVAQAREIITSSIMGLLLAIFSLLILRIISVDILRLPGFS